MVLDKISAPMLMTNATFSLSALVSHQLARDAIQLAVCTSWWEAGRN